MTSAWRHDPETVMTHFPAYYLLLFWLVSLLAGCAGTADRPGELRPLASLPDWQQDRVAEAWPALRTNCNSALKRFSPWREICIDLNLLGDDVDEETARAFLETRFVARMVESTEGDTRGLFTGYYEPMLRGDFRRHGPYQYPLYRQPPNLLRIELSELYPELNGRPVRGRLVGNRVVPYYSRAQIENGKDPLKGHELIWVDNPVDAFFLHVQGSGRVTLPNGRIMAVGYADQNGHPYESIGTHLIRSGAIEREEMSMQSIRAWIDENPSEMISLLHSNPSYIFFALRDNDLPGPLGSLRVPLTAGRSLAVDRRYVPMGSLLWLDTTWPLNDELSFRRLMVAQDTGGAIKGAVRADVFFGHGDEAAKMAGLMKQSGHLYLLLPRSDRYPARAAAAR